jgi:hypothetical protein
MKKSVKFVSIAIVNKGLLPVNSARPCSSCFKFLYFGSVWHQSVPEIYNWDLFFWAKAAHIAILKPIIIPSHPMADGDIKLNKLIFNW